KGNKPVLNSEDDHLSDALNDDLKKLIANAPGKTDLVTSHLSPQYISWRYEKNPLFRYSYFTDNRNFLMICRIKSHSFGRELRIVEFILLNPGADIKKINKEMKAQVAQFCKTKRVDFVSVSGLQYSSYKDYFQWMGFIPTRAIGPVITLKDLNMHEKFPSLLQIENWSYSLGD